MGNLQPFRLSPSYKDYIWGGSRLALLYNKKTGLERVAESWELSAHIAGPCVISSGPFCGMKFSEFVREHPEAVSASSPAEFPILVKLIDAREKLSVQVHPNDAFAKTEENCPGKTELWYILEAEPSAFIYLGVNRRVSREEFMQRIGDGTVEEILNRVPVKKGGVYFVEAGLLHAIGKGIVLAEVQQNSDVTYRVYDYGRLGNDGKPRELHIEKALRTAILDPLKPALPGESEAGLFEGYGRKRVVRCRYFEVQSTELRGALEERASDGSFLFILCVEGSMTASYEGGEFFLNKGDSAFLPAGASVKLAGSSDYISASLPSDF
jgi:mannose-6-phosphate isomerase